MEKNLHALALAALQTQDCEQKCLLVQQLGAAWAAGQLEYGEGEDDCQPLLVPGRPPRPELVPPAQLTQRKPGRAAGHAALLHAIAHIEFNAINLALDCLYRFRQQPVDFYRDWVKVATEETYHFGLLGARLQALGHVYGDFPAHDGLWQMACRTADDLLARMALVPRVLEARGLDATPQIVVKLRRIGDEDSIAVLEIILRDEIGHVAIGDRWFRRECARRGLVAEDTYLALIERFEAPWPQPPLHRAARLAAGFTADELDALLAKGAAAKGEGAKPAAEQACSEEKASDG